MCAYRVSWGICVYVGPVALDALGFVAASTDGGALQGCVGTKSGGALLVHEALRAGSPTDLADGRPADLRPSAVGISYGGPHLCR